LQVCEYSRSRCANMALSKELEMAQAAIVTKSDQTCHAL
jgi:hypothetical protein